MHRLSLLCTVAFLVCQQVISAQTVDNPYNVSIRAVSSTIRGVNLGGWLVMESFITPSMFRAPGVVDEWTYAVRAKSSPAFANNLRNHWNRWYSESDLKAVANAGLTHVRIPLPYWMFLTQRELDRANEPFLLGQMPYLTRLLGWCKKHGLKVILDIHAAPGSQNPWPHSGRIGAGVRWGTGNTISRHLLVLDRLAATVKNFWNANAATSGVVWGIEPINEAFPVTIVGGITTVKNFYIRAYHVVRKHVSARECAFVIEEAFSASTNTWVNFMPPPKYQNVYLDIHLYHVFDGRVPPRETHIQRACGPDRNRFAHQTLPAFCGEWSASYQMPGVAVHYEPYPTGDQQRFLRRWVAAQMHNYEAAKGWMYWTLKTESAPLWSFLAGLGKWIPGRYPSAAVRNAC